MTQTELDFDGRTYNAKRDRSRLSVQLERVKLLMLSGGWWTLGELENALGHPQASISARLRDLRKSRFGGYTVEREHMTGGLWRYRMTKP